jgi:hypothetical protein
MIPTEEDALERLEILDGKVVSNVTVGGLDSSRT